MCHPLSIGRHLARCRSAVLLLTSVPVGLLTVACAPALDWREVRPPEASGLRAMFPCKPDQVTRLVQLPGLRQKPEMHMLSCQTGDVTWALSYARLPHLADVGPTLSEWPRLMRDNLQAASKLVPQGGPVEMVSVGAVRVPGMTPQHHAQGWRFQAKRADAWGRPLKMAVTSWHFAYGLQIFQASVSRPLGTDPSGVAQDDESFFRDAFQFPG